MADYDNVDGYGGGERGGVGGDNLVIEGDEVTMFNENDLSHYTEEQLLNLLSAILCTMGMVPNDRERADLNAINEEFIGERITSRVGRKKKGRMSNDETDEE